MRDFANPTPGVPYLAEHSARTLDQMADRLQGEINSHMRRATKWFNGQEPTVQLSLDEARLMIGNLSRSARFLRLVSEGLV